MWIVLGDGAKIFTKKQRAKSIHLSKKWTMSITGLWFSMMFQFITLVLIVNLTEISMGAILRKAGLSTDDMTILGVTMAVFNMILIIVFILLKLRMNGSIIFHNMKVAGKKYDIVHQSGKRYVCFNKDEITIYVRRKFRHDLNYMLKVGSEDIKSIETFNVADINSIEFNDAGGYSSGNLVLDIGWTVSMSFNQYFANDMYKLIAYIKDNYTLDAHDSNALYWIQTQ